MGCGDAQSSTGDAHGGRDGDTILRGENDSDSRSQFHRVTTGGRLEGKTVTQHAHDIISVYKNSQYPFKSPKGKPLTSRQTDDDPSTTKHQNPNGHITLLTHDLARLPHGINSAIRPNSIRHIIRPMRKTSRARRHDLYKRIQVLDLVIILFSTSVHLGHAVPLSRLLFVPLEGVDIDGGAVGEDFDDEGDGFVAGDDPKVAGCDPGAFDGVGVFGLWVLNVGDVVGVVVLRVIVVGELLVAAFGGYTGLFNVRMSGGGCHRHALIPVSLRVMDGTHSLVVVHL
jgi:hypothetical protein